LSLFSDLASSTSRSVEKLTVKVVLTLALMLALAAEAWVDQPPLGLDIYLPAPITNPLTREKVALGGGCFSTSGYRAMGRSRARAVTITGRHSRTAHRRARDQRRPTSIIIRHCGVYHG